VSRHFDGTDDEVSITANHLDDVNTFTYAFWMNCDLIDNTQPAFAKGTGGTNSFKSAGFNSAYNSLGLDVVRDTTNAFARGPSGIVSAGVWKACAFTFDATDGPRLFHSPTIGSEVVEVASYQERQVGSGSVSADTTYPLHIGASPAAADFFDGLLARFGFWSTKLTPGEMTLFLYGGGIPAPSNFLGWWELGVASPEPDWSGFAANGTVTGALIGATHPPVLLWPEASYLVLTAEAAPPESATVLWPAVHSPYVWR
jgi:hypothetical protein